LCLATFFGIGWSLGDKKYLWSEKLHGILVQSPNLSNVHNYQKNGEKESTHGDGSVSALRTTQIFDLKEQNIKKTFYVIASQPIDYMHHFFLPIFSLLC